MNHRSAAGALAAMLEARSVAVVGASPRPGSPGLQMVHQLVAGGFDGDVFPVNPKYEEIEGLRCYAKVTEVPSPPDLVLLGVPNSALEEQLELSVEAGARAAVVFASAHGDGSGGGPLASRLGRIAADAGMVLCGPNCMGFVNVERRVRALAFHEREDLEPGPIAWLSHSGSAFSALLHNRRGLRFSVAVSTGLETTTTMADYLRYALERTGARVAALFVEAVRDPEGFLDALRLAAEADVPVVALTVGRASEARRMVEAHSGALAGEDAAYEAVFDAYGVSRVETLDEMADTLELFAAGRPARRGGLASVHDSGGERAHLIDVAADVGVPFARISDQTTAALASLLDPGLPAVNPLDAWGTGRDYEAVFSGCMRALAADPDTGALAFAVDLSGEDLEPGYVDVAREVVPSVDVPFAVLTNMAGAVAPGAADDLRRAGIPVLEGTRTGLLAFRHLFELRDARSRRAVVDRNPVPDEVRQRWLDRLDRGDPWTEVEALQLLADYGIPVVAAEIAASEDEAVQAADRVGGPVALKTAEAAHKTDVDGVRLGLAGEDAIRGAYRDIAGRLGPRVTVAAMASPGVELALGAVRDPQFGPLVLAGAGGALVEVLRDRRMALPPLDTSRARTILDRLAVRPLLAGVRGGPPADVDAVAHALVRLSLIAADLGDRLEALDVNPVIAGPDGCVAVDALVVPVR
ncbi:MAG TPA: acetate--CoA ligase family protein [Actinomycetota bacterium]|nr:acetate--CoA ligase family protein [Actinomycetota bacterium]